ncbi:DUF5667 domain-containing protein [Streptomyces sp. XD-27]|uniref:DUF5667 domain-containing protein n=1 Tax=Streptomyces sp. XD-27 TaxID=3062779 RepID=UPI0026F47B79|nr:DUF5667 domain-containing protein [Streptomyces sp. XD-27]WKX71854.1 DUF5667 domain-containing protein [Streptomyces sp. XD-27]
MIAKVSAHRRANAFAQALEALEDQHQDLQDTTAGRPGAPADEAERARLLALANGLGELPAPELDPGVRTTQRAELIAAMEAAFAERGSRVPEQRDGKGTRRTKPFARFRPRSRWSRGLAAGGLTVGVAAGAFGGVAAASSDALPGDTLYGFKRGMEDLKLNLADGDVDRGRIYLDQASTRMSEARRLMERARSGQLDHEELGEVRKALSGMRHDAAEGHRLLYKAYAHDGSLGPIQSLDSFAKSHRDSWSRLRSALPVQLTDVSHEVSSVLDAIDENVGPLRSLLPTAPGAARSTSDGTSGSATARSGASDRDGALPPSAPPASAGQPQGAAQSPSPSPSGGEERQGLIAGADGLLDPPREAGLPLPSAGGVGDSSAQPKPDVTIPPLLPGLLPDLGLGGEETR